MLNQRWIFKYEPDKLEKMIVNSEIKPLLQKSIIDTPNIMLYGTAGVGKGTFTKILLKHTKHDKLWINASDHTGIDFIRDTVKPFATAASLTPIKIVVMNEADSLTRGVQGAQKMLKQLMEDVEKITRFVFLTNDITLMMDELKSRCMVIKIDNPPAKEIAKHCINILKKENIKYKMEDIVSIVKKCYPDIRKTIISLENNVNKGQLRGDVVSDSEELFNKIMRYSLDGDLENVRKELKSNYIDYPNLYKHFYENAGEFKEPGGAILTIGEHLYWHVGYPIPEINFIHMITDMIYNKVI